MNYILGICLLLCVGCSSASDHNPHIEEGKTMVLTAVQERYPDAHLTIADLSKLTYPEHSRSKSWGATFTKNNMRYLVAVSRKGVIIEHYKAAVAPK